MHPRYTKNYPKPAQPKKFATTGNPLGGGVRYTSVQRLRNPMHLRVKRSRIVWVFYFPPCPWVLKKGKILKILLHSHLFVFCEQIHFQYQYKLLSLSLLYPNYLFLSPWCIDFSLFLSHRARTHTDTHQCLSAHNAVHTHTHHNKGRKMLYHEKMKANAGPCAREYLNMQLI